MTCYHGDRPEKMTVMSESKGQGDHPARQALGRIKAGQDATSEAMRAWQERGELQHLHGKKLDMGDDSPEWLVNRILKQEGFLPPLIERGQDLDRAQHEADAILDRLRRRREWLLRPEARTTAANVRAFDEARERGLDEYRAALASLNRGIRDYNLVAPAALHRRGIRLDQHLEDVAASIAPLQGVVAVVSRPDEENVKAPTTGLRGIWRRLKRDNDRGADASRGRTAS